MSRLISDAIVRAEPVAIPFASEASIYGRFGVRHGLHAPGLHDQPREGKLAPGTTPQLTANLWGFQNLVTDLDLGFYAALVCVDEAAEDSLALDPLLGEVDGG